MKSDFTVLISRIIHNNLAFFGEDFKKLVVQHIPLTSASMFGFRSSTGRNKLSTHVQWKGPDRRLPLIDDLRRTSSDSFIYDVS